MKGLKTPEYGFPLFAGLLSTEPSQVWETLDDTTREQLVECLARLLLAHVKTDACRSPAAPQHNHGVNPL